MNKKMRHIDFSFGASLRNAREKRNYRREQIAERAEISPRFLAAIESGRRKPSLDVLIRLVNAIGASFDGFTFTLGETIAQGCPACQIRFDKVKK